MHIAIIPARGGSKRLPGKNILEINGKPMIAWTIKAAIESNKYDSILVSTDDPVIAEISIDLGAEVPFLRKKAADDLSTSSEATLAALYQAEEHWLESYEFVTQLMPNCPLRNHSDVVNAVENFLLVNPPAQISCFRFGWMNPWWAVELKENMQPVQIFTDAIKQRSQDLPVLHCPTGAIWIAKASELKQNNSFYVPNHIFFEMGWLSAMDIDDKNDLEMAKICFLSESNKIES